jgi:hypothetical protein
MHRMSSTEPPAREQQPVTFEAPHSNGAGHTQARELPRAHFPWLAVLIAIAFALICVGIVVGWTFFGSRPSPERLDDTSATDVQAACAAAQRDLADLPALPNPAPGADRVDRIRAENEILETMADRWDAVEPTSSTPASALSQWTDDWRSLIQARENYASDLETERRARFVVPADRGIKPVTDRMDDFVREQSGRIDICSTTALAAEVVEGERQYEPVED